MTKPQVGDLVSVLVPGVWERRGVVEETDYHPLGVDDAVKIRFDDGIHNLRCSAWWSLRWVVVRVPAVLPQEQKRAADV